MATHLRTPVPEPHRVDDTLRDRGGGNSSDCDGARMRFKTFICVAVAIAAALAGVTFARLEAEGRKRQQELTQTQLNNCKLKLYDLAVGYEARAAHANPNSPQYNPRQAAVLAGALRVVLTIPSAKECVPVVKEAISKQKSPAGLSPKVERELFNLAERAPSSATLTSPPTARHTVQPTPHVTITVPQPRTTPSKPVHKSATPTIITQPSTPQQPTITVTTPTPPPVVTTTTPTPPVTVPPVEVPPIKVEVPSICVQAGPIQVGCH